MAILDFLKRKPRQESPSDFPYTRMKTVVDKIFTDTQEQRDEMSRFLKRYKGEWWDKDKLKDTDSTVQANLFFATVMTIAPLITDNRPIWSVRARAPYMQNYMEAFSLALEYLWDKLEMDAEVFKWILDALIMKIGIMKCYYNPDAEFGGEVAVEVVDPRNFFCAPGYDDIWKSPLCGIRVSKPLSWVRTAYPDKGKDVKPDVGDGKEDITIATDAQQWELETKYANVYEVWLKDDEAENYFVREEAGKEIETDAKDEGAQKKSRQKYPFGRIVVFTKDAILEDRASPFRHGKPPYVALYDYLVPHDLIGMGEGNQMEELNKSFNRNLQLIDAWTKFYCDPPWLLDTNAGLEMEKVKQQLLAGGGIFEYNATLNPDPLKKVAGATLDQAVPMFMNMLLKLNEEITGVTDITKGMTSKSQRQSATEISTLAESAYTRTRQRVKNFEGSIKRILYLMLENMQQFYTEPRKFSLSENNQINYYTVSNSKAQAQELLPKAGTGETPDEDAQIMADYERFIAEFGEVDEIYAAFDLEIQTNSSLPMDKQSLANLFLRLLEMAGGNPVTGMPMWEAALAALHIPRYKEITAKMEELFNKQNQPPAAPGVPGAETGGPPQLMQLIQGAANG